MPPRAAMKAVEAEMQRNDGGNGTMPPMPPRLDRVIAVAEYNRHMLERHGDLLAELSARSQVLAWMVASSVALGTVTAALSLALLLTG